MASALLDQLRILIVSTTYPPAANGQAVFTAQLAEGLARRDHSVVVAAPSERGEAYRERRAGVLVEALAAVQLGNLPDAHFPPYPRPGLRRILDEFQPDVVHLQDHYPLARWAHRTARRRGLPVMGTNHFLPRNIVHYVLPFRFGRGAVERALWWTMRSLYNRLDLVTTPTETAVDILRHVGLRVPLRAISCGVDVQRYRPEPGLDRAKILDRYELAKDVPLLVYVGRVDEEKDLEVALEAVRRVPERLQLALIGVGRYHQEIRGHAEKKRLDGRVRFTGYVPDQDLTDLIQAADVFVMPSPVELQSIATLEAMAMGKPVLAARARALPELVHEGENGYLFEPGNAADAAAKLRRLLSERACWPEMGRASRRLAEPHDIENTVDQYVEVYRGLLEEQLLAASN